MLQFPRILLYTRWDGLPQKHYLAASNLHSILYYFTTFTLSFYLERYTGKCSPNGDQSDQWRSISEHGHSL